MQTLTRQPAGALSEEASARSVSRAQVERADRCSPRAAVGEAMVQPMGPIGPSMRCGDQPRGTDDGLATERAVSAATEASGPEARAASALAAARAVPRAGRAGSEDTNGAAGAARAW